MNNMERIFHIINEERPVPLQFVKNAIEICSYLYHSTDFASMSICQFPFMQNHGVVGRVGGIVLDDDVVSSELQSPLPETQAIRDLTVSEVVVGDHVSPALHVSPPIMGRIEA